MSASHRDARPNGTGQLVRADHGAQKIRDLVEYRPSLESTLQPTPLKDLLVSEGASVAIFSRSRELIRTVERAAGEEYPTFVIDSWPALLAAVNSGRCGIALVDADEVGAHVEARLAELRRYGDRLVMLVAADRARATGLIGFLSSHEIHRLLITPPTVGNTRLLIESAVARYLQLRYGRENDIIAPAPDVAAPPLLATTKLFLRSRPNWPIAAGVLFLLAGIAVVGSLTRSLWTVVPDQSAAAPMPDPFAALLASGQLAFNQGRLVEPPGDSALDYYLTIVTANPEHPEARAQLGLVVDTLFAQAEAALVSDSVDAAAAALEHIRRAAPTSARLAFLDTQVTRARERFAELAASAAAEADAAAETEPAETAPDLDDLLTLLETRIRQGQLLQPAGDSARVYLERARALAPTDPRVAVARANLAVAVAAAARTVLDSGELQQSARLIAEARSLGADRETLAAIDTQAERLRAEQQRARNAGLLASAMERLERGDLLAPEEDSALHYFEALRAEDPTFPGLAAAWQTFLERLAANAQAAIEARDWTTADRWWSALQTAAPQEPQTRAISDEIVVARRRVEFLENTVAASELDLISYRPPVYPFDARRDGIAGWVQLEYVVTEDGSTRDLVVVQAEPAGRFERAALAAAATYRYAPFELDGRTYARRVWLRIRFTLE
jgi:protein TonB